jgi:hypothetical protein
MTLAQLIKLRTTPFYMMWVVELKVHITTSMSGFPIHFRAQFLTPLHDQNILERRVTLASIVNLMVSLTLLRW